MSTHRQRTYNVNHGEMERIALIANCVNEFLEADTISERGVQRPDRDCAVSKDSAFMLLQWSSIRKRRAQLYVVFSAEHALQLLTMSFVLGQGSGVRCGSLLQ
jgi:hypothetical protein